jgi:hypothetical protein
MMKKFFLFVTAVLTVVGCGDSSNGEKVAPERYGWDGPDLYGNVKSVTVTSYNLSSKFGEEIIGDEVQNDVYNFDSSHGNVISKNSVDKSDSTLVYEDYTCHVMKFPKEKKKVKIKKFKEVKKYDLD